MKKIYFLILMLGNCILFGQNSIPNEMFGNCLSDEVYGGDKASLTSGCEHTSTLWSNENLWLPDDVFESKYIKVNFVFLHKDDGTGNFVSGNPEHDSLIMAIVDKVNYDYSHLINFQDTDCHIDDELFKSHAKIQIVPNILHFNSSNYWNNENKPVRPIEWHGNYLDSLDLYLRENNMINKGITVYFSETQSYYDSLVINNFFMLNGPPIHFASAESPSTSDLNKPMRIHMPDAYSKYVWMKTCCPTIYNKPWYPNIRSWFVTTAGNLLAHEIGHCLGLSHITNCHHNLMYTYPNNEGDYEASLSPSQICKIHKNLSLSNIRKFTTDQSYISTPYNINGTVLWDLDFTSYRDVVVKNGGTLTITCNLVMKSFAKIVVEPGGSLIVDGGSITTEDNTQWPGIQVWGNSNASQSMHHGIYSQGYVELTNGATIENAVCAINLWKPNDYTKTGGIVVATDANFVNNAQAVCATHYIYTNNGVELNYNANFTRCNFEVNDDYLGTETFYKHVGLNTVKGVEFRGCSFSVDRTASNIATYCLGIGAEDASFTVTSHCNVPNTSPCPNGSLSVGTFTGFYNAIYAIYTYTQRPFIVQDCEFNDNINGIYAINTGFAQILGNTFYVPSESICTFGVYLEGMSSFAVGSNEFIGIGTGCENCGVGVKNSPYDNIIEQNSFSNLAFGTESIGKNYDYISVRPARYVTLNYLCNNNSSNVLADFYAINDESNFGGVHDQGSSSQSAGNTFSSNNTQHIANLTTHSFTYYYDTIYSGRKPTSTYGVNLSKTNNANDCGMGGGGGSNNKSSLTDYEEAEDNCNRIITALEAENDPNNIEVLEAELVQAEHQRLTIVGNAVRNILMDSVSDINDVRQWLNRADTPSADRAICATYLSQRDYETALNKAVAMIDKYEMEDDALIEQTEYIGILKLQRKVETEGRVMGQLNSDELEQVQHLAENGTGIARSMAKALLQMNGNFFECDCNNEIQTRESENTKADAVNKPSENEEYYLTVSPVPAKDYIIVSYSLPTDHGTLTITNNLGMKVKTVNIEGKQGKKVVSLDEISAGVYTCTIQGEGFTKTEKIVITK